MISSVSAQPFSGRVWYTSTDLANKSKVSESEFRNRQVVDTARLGLRVNYKLLHAVVEKEKISSKGKLNDDATDTLINNDRLWFGVGFHTTKDTYVTLYNDKNSDFWKFQIDTNFEIRPRLKLLSRVYHLDHRGGTLAKSGGRRTTGIGLGFEYRLFKGASARLMYESGNNTSDFVEDRLLTGLTFDF